MSPKNRDANQARTVLFLHVTPWEREASHLPMYEVMTVKVRASTPERAIVHAREAIVRERETTPTVPHPKDLLVVAVLFGHLTPEAVDSDDLRFGKGVPV